MPSIECQRYTRRNERNIFVCHSFEAPMMYFRYDYILFSFLLYSKFSNNVRRLLLKIICHFCHCLENEEYFLLGILFWLDVEIYDIIGFIIHFALSFRLSEFNIHKNRVQSPQQIYLRNLHSLNGISKLDYLKHKCKHMHLEPNKHAHPTKCSAFCIL